MPTMAPEKRKSGRGRPPKHAGERDESGRTGTPVSLRLDPELREKMPEFIREFRRRSDVKLSMTDVVELALRKLYREYGVLPPPDPDRSSSK